MGEGQKSRACIVTDCCEVPKQRIYSVDVDFVLSEAVVRVQGGRARPGIKVVNMPSICCTHDPAKTVEELLQVSFPCVVTVQCFVGDDAALRRRSVISALQLDVTRTRLR